MLKTTIVGLAALLALTPSANAILLLVSPTTAAEVEIDAILSDQGECVVVHGSANVHASGGALFDYRWEIDWTIRLSDGSTVQGPSGSAAADGRTFINELREINGLRLQPGWRISGTAEIDNNQLGGLDSSFASGSWRCQSGGILVPELLLAADGATPQPAAPASPALATTEQ